MRETQGQAFGRVVIIRGNKRMFWCKVWWILSLNGQDEEFFEEVSCMRAGRTCLSLAAAWQRRMQHRDDAGGE